MTKEIDELRFLDPKERLKRLKELEDKRKKEIEEAHKLIEDTEHELDDKKEKERIPIQQIKADTDAALFGETEHEIFRMKRFVDKKESDDKEVKEEKPLEETVFTEALRLTPEQVAEQKQYHLMLSKEPTAELYNRVKEIYQNVNEQAGGITDYQRTQLYNINKAMEIKEQDIESGTYDPTDYIRHELNLGERLIKTLMGDYTK